MKNLYQQVQGLGIKRINYEYDLISGKVNFVAYQNGKADQFYYQYNYDADNRITQAWSSIQADTTTWGFYSKLDPAKQKLDATYQYYLHGPLARMELGDVSTKVQGVDYACTLQGWIKGVNSQNLIASQDMGQDSATVAKDAYGYSLGYYTNDYKPIGGTTTYTAFNDQYTQNTGDITGQSLYNGNISTSTYAISPINSGNAVGYTYHYDQLNRIKHLRQHSGIASWSHSNINSGYSEDFTFDGNRNILSLLRSGTTSATKDSLLYQYNYTGGRLANNQLNWLKGHGAATNMGTDQSANNYTYDAIGNLTADVQAHVSGINWNVYGKITGMLDSTKTISYLYNTAQERVTKTANGLTTYYIRDGQGNTLAVYDNKAGQINWREQQLYGNGRLGMWNPNVNLATNNASTVWDTIGKKRYELGNHLGNVIITLTDSRTAHTGYYTSNIISSQDYYAFGALMPGRNISSGGYRYGFNGKENDNEVKEIGNQQDYGMRIYDPRVGRFLSVDPLVKNYPSETPFQFSGDSPIEFKDLDGMEELQPDIYHISMKNCPTTYRSVSGRVVKTTYTLHGWPRNYLYYWDKVLENDPQALDARNVYRVKELGLAPEVTTALKEHLMTKGFDVTGLVNGEILIHHHINQGSNAVAMGETSHREIPNEVSKFRFNRSNALQRLGKLNETLSFVGLFLDMTSDDPLSSNMILTAGSKSNTLYYDVLSRSFYMITNAKIVKDKNGNVVSKTVTFDYYSDYDYDEKTHQYVGVDKQGTRTETYDVNKNETQGGKAYDNQEQ